MCQELCCCLNSLQRNRADTRKEQEISLAGKLGSVQSGARVILVDQLKEWVWFYPFSSNIFIEFQSLLESVSASSPWRRSRWKSKPVCTDFLPGALKQLHEDFFYYFWPLPPHPPLIRHSVSHQRSPAPLNAPWFGICSNLKPLSSKGHMPCLPFGGCLRLPPGKHFLGALWGLLCLIYPSKTTMEDPLSLICSTRRQHTRSVPPWAGLVPSERYKLFHCRYIPAISIPMVRRL